MEKKHQVHNLIILDESGSMASVRETVIQGFNEIVQTVKGIEKEFPEQEHFISLISFNGLGNKLLHFIDPASKLTEIDDKRYLPDASTPLYDAMGFALTKLRQTLEHQTNYNVLVTILTDGEENASREYSGNDIKSLVEELKLNRWTFTYIGTDHDVTKAALSISITNTIKFEKNDEAMKDMFQSEKKPERCIATKYGIRKILVGVFMIRIRGK
ncbi:vWA domain-containing protein [Dyadobacter sp. NIV53]|uniref:vWA domain-containing protein n=1 Tax=Dyadobacter sp. NIV53 TaxID=2861765 RepID=UPI001C871DE8|nr:vWA domain-containing protein [Dyadobacter sp. NIV53]